MSYMCWFIELICHKVTRVHHNLFFDFMSSLLNHVNKLKDRWKVPWDQSALHGRKSQCLFAGLKETIGLLAFYILTKTSNNGRGRRSVVGFVRSTQTNLILALFHPRSNVNIQRRTTLTCLTQSFGFHILDEVSKFLVVLWRYSQNRCILVQ